MGFKWLHSASRLFILTVWLGFIVLAAPAQADEPDGYLPDEVLVKLVQATDLPAVTVAYGLDPTPLAQFGSQPIFRLQISDGADPFDKATTLANDARVVYAEPNFLNQTPEGRKKSSWASGDGEDDYQEQWAVDKIRLPAAHTVTRGAGVTVAVLDTGVDVGHPALAGRLVAGYDFVDLDSDPSEVGTVGEDLVYGHGTHVAGLVALAAPEARIMPVRVLDREGIGNIWVLAEALAYAADPDGDPATDDGAQVINLSLGTTRPTDLLAEIVGVVTCDDDDGGGDDDDCSFVGGRGVVVVVAAGNSSSDSPEYPAAEGVAGSLAVAASTPADTLADFSSRGSWVHVAAPGESILSSVPGGRYGVWSGTSMAAPLVAGEAALVRAANPNLNAIEVSNQIMATAATIDGSVPRRIDAAAALGLPQDVVIPPAVPPSGCGSQMTVSATADAWIEQNSPSNNKGADSILKIQSKSPSDNFRTLVQFALPARLPQDCTIESAKLRLFAASSTSNRTLQAIRLAASWTENGVTWSNQPATAGGPAMTSSGSGYREWDVTAQVRAGYNVGANHGFLIRDAAESNSGAEQQFHSREKGESMPQLFLHFGAASPPADTTPPETAINSGPDTTTTSTEATFVFSANESGSTFRCSLDGALFSPCVSPVQLTGLAVGAHIFYVRAIDPAGNLDTTPPNWAWAVQPPADTIPPETTIDLGPAATTESKSAMFTFSANEPNTTFDCSLDGAAFTDCASPQTYTDLSEGEHTLEVRATDLAGNGDPTPAVTSWMIMPPSQPMALSCGQILTQSTLITNDLLNCPGDGLVIGADGLMLDLNGHTIDGTGLGAGIRNDGFDGVTIRNGTVQEFDYGVQLNPGTAHNIVSSLTVQLNQEAGIQLSDTAGGVLVAGNTIQNNIIEGNETGLMLNNATQGTRVFGNTIGRNSDYSVRLVNSAGNVLEANLITGSSDIAVSLEGASSNTLVGNTISDSSDSALAILGASNDNRIEDNMLTGSGDAGIFIADSVGNKLIANTVRNMIDSAVLLENAHDTAVRDNDLRFNANGVQLSASTGNRLESNDVSGSTGTGIEIDNSDRNIIVLNTANGNKAEGISVDSLALPGSGNLLDRNTASGNSGNGLYIAQSGHTITGNTAENNDSWGIYAAVGNTDGGGNQAVGNSEPLQCFGLSCNGSGPLPPDLTPPDTAIDDDPDETTTTTSAAFTFSANEPGLIFECSLDGTTFATCVSPAEYNGLEDGEHVFNVRATDLSGNIDPTPASATWTVDATPPETAIDLSPAVTTTDPSATFTFSSGELNSTFECSLDGVAFSGCASPGEHTGLAFGEHTFQVRAIDPVGNTDPTPASYSWTISAPPNCGAPVTIFAEADSWLDQNSASNNFRSDSILKVQSKGPSNNFRALVRFALPTGLPQGCVVQSATLRLYAASGANGRTLQAIQVAGDWTENSVTWNNQPQTTGPAVMTTSGQGYREWSVASQMQAIYDTGANYGFLIRDASESDSGSEQQFHSREKGENPPMLVITFGPAGG